MKKHLKLIKLIIGVAVLIGCSIVVFKFMKKRETSRVIIQSKKSAQPQPIGTVEE